MKDNASATKYGYVKNELLRRMDEGEFAATGRIPSENELSRAYQVSVITTRKALSELVHEGRVVRIKGKGSFVVPIVGEQSENDAQSKPAAGRGIVPMILTSSEQNDSPRMGIISGAQTYLSAKGYSMSIECNNKDAQTEAEILDRCLRERVAGVLLFSTDPTQSAPKLAQLARAGIPVVLLDRDVEAFPCTMVASYHFDGMFQVSCHLLEQGHRRIIYMANELQTNVHRERFQGYEAALQQYEVEVLPQLCLTENYSQMHCLAQCIAQHDATAVVCINDGVALRVMEYLQEKGLRVPEDISVTGFDDNEIGRYAGLTTVRQQFREIGRLSAKKLLELIGKKSSNSRTFLPVELVVRKSTGPARQV